MRKGGGGDGWLRLRLIVRGGSRCVYLIVPESKIFVCKTCLEVGGPIFLSVCAGQSPVGLLINFRGTGTLHDRVRGHCRH